MECKHPVQVRSGRSPGRGRATLRTMDDESPPPRLRPRPWLPIAGAILGGAAGFAFYYFYGCDSG